MYAKSIHIINNLLKKTLSFPSFESLLCFAAASSWDIFCLLTIVRTSLRFSVVPAMLSTAVLQAYFPESFGDVRARFTLHSHFSPHVHIVRVFGRQLMDRYYCLVHIYHAVGVHLTTSRSNSKTNILIDQHTAFHL